MPLPVVHNTAEKAFDTGLVSLVYVSHDKSVQSVNQPICQRVICQWSLIVIQ